MDTAEIIVTLSGAALIGFVVWYFFLAARRPTAAPAPDTTTSPETPPRSALEPGRD
jgi:plastocyanin domain-containing protein